MLRKKHRKPLRPTSETAINLVQDEEKMDERNILDHQFVVAAYTVTWVIQLGYLAFLGFKWRSEKRNAERKSRQAH
jgi:hypothetical protein